MIKKSIVALSVALLLAGSIQAADQNIYVNSAAGAGGDGTVGTPFDTLSDLNWTTIAGYVTAGDTVYIELEKGSTFTEQLTVGASGVAGRPITIRAHGTGDKPIITGSDTRDICLYIASKDYITVQNLNLIDPLVSCLEIGGSSANVIVTGVDVSGSGNQGFQMTHTASATYNTITAADCVDDGFSMHDNAVAVINTGTITTAADGINIIEGANLTANDVTISACTSYSIWLSASDGTCTATFTRLDASGVMINADTACTLNIVDSLIHDVTGIGIVVEGTVNVTGSTITDCTTNLILVSDATGTTFAVLNRCLLDSGTGHQIDITAGDLQATNCIFLGAASAKFAVAVRVGESATLKHCIFASGKVGKGVFVVGSVTIVNSIFFQTAVGLTLSGTPTVALSYSCFYDNTLAFSGGTPDNTGGITTDPAFLNAGGSYALATDFSIPITSPCRNAGTNASVTTDYAGSPRPRKSPDIGAYEFQEGGSGGIIGGGVGGML